jgi:hypothetical protein
MCERLRRACVTHACYVAVFFSLKNKEKIHSLKYILQIAANEMAQTK